ncbi:MAG: cell wall hydrolase [Kiloniellaceae bacterium]
MALYLVYLSGAALAGQPGAGINPFFGRHLGKFPGLAQVGGDKARLFERPTRADPRDEIACLALNIYFEARGEPDQGKLAVGHVVMNRVASSRFPDTICDVVRQGGELRRYRCQFTWWCDGRSDTPRNQRDWRISNQFALAVYWGFSLDPTDGALWYHADYVSPAWRKDFEMGPKIGRHIFYRRPAGVTRVASRMAND